jgi:hypothetical protein
MGYVLGMLYQRFASMPLQMIRLPKECPTTYKDYPSCHSKVHYLAK